jgi:hypothetical protein
MLSLPGKLLMMQEVPLKDIS